MSYTGQDIGGMLGHFIISFPQNSNSFPRNNYLVLSTWHFEGTKYYFEETK